MGDHAQVGLVHAVGETEKLASQSGGEIDLAAHAVQFG